VFDFPAIREPTHHRGRLRSNRPIASRHAAFPIDADSGAGRIVGMDCRALPEAVSGGEPRVMIQGLRTLGRDMEDGFARRFILHPFFAVDLFLQGFDTSQRCAFRFAERHIVAVDGTGVAGQG